MKFTKVLAILLCSTVLFCGCAKNSDIAIKVNDKGITKGEFYKDFETIKNLQLKNTPKEYKKDDSYIVLALKENFVKDVIARELLSQEFDKRKITASEEEIKAKKQDMIKQVGSIDRFNVIIKENGISEERLNSDIASEVKLAKLLSSISKKKIKDSDVEKYYKANKADFTTPEKVQVSHILLITNPDLIKQQIKQADKKSKLTDEEINSKVQEQLKKAEELAIEVQKKAVANPKNFASLAKEYSQDPGSAQQGGDLGYITKDSVVKEFGEVAFNQKVGTVSPLVKSPFGTHIIYVKDKASKTTQTLADVKADLKTFLERKANSEVFNEFLHGLKNKATIEYVDMTLNPTYIKAQIKASFDKLPNKKTDKK